KPTWSRMAHSSGVLGSASTETCRLFKVNETMFPPLAVCLFVCMGAPAYRWRWPIAREGGPIDVEVLIVASLASGGAVSHRKSSKQPGVRACSGSSARLRCGAEPESACTRVLRRAMAQCGGDFAAWRQPGIALRPIQLQVRPTCNAAV